MSARLDDDTADEVGRLQRCVDDLAGLIARPSTWSGGEPLRIAGTLLDTLLGMLDLAAANDALRKELADRRQAEAALREREANARMIVNSIPAGIALLSPAGKVEVVNEQFVEYFGKSLDELKDWAGAGVVHPDDLPYVIAQFTHWMATGTGFENVARLRRFDGTYR